MTSPFNPNLPPDYPVGPKRVPYLVLNRDPLPTDTKYRDGNWYEPNTEAKNDGVNPPRIWKLAKIYSKTNALWQLISGGTGGTITDLRGDDGALATPNLGVVDVLGFVVANGTNPKPVYTNNTTTANTSRIEVQLTTASASLDENLAGLAYFDPDQFNVSAEGRVQLQGGQSVTGVNVQAISGTGTDPVLPDPITGLITVDGALVASGTNPIRSVSTLPNQYQIQAQTAQALSAPDSTKVGMANFSSLDHSVDADGFVQSKNSNTVVGIRNLGFSYNSGTGVFTIAGQNGNALSATNPAYVTLQDKSNFGQLVTIAVTANQTFIDAAGASEIVGNLFGLTTAIAVTVDIPFYLYAVVNDAQNSIAFMISRFPSATASPVSAKIGMPSSAVANTQGSFFSLENVTATDYDQNPCVCVGCFRMRMNGSDDWTVQTLTNSDGIGRFFAGYIFAYPRGQFGAATGKYFKDNGGTAPDDSAGGYAYYIDAKNGRAIISIAFPSIDTGGVGAVIAQVALPFNRMDGATMGGGFFKTGANYAILQMETSPGSNTNQMPYVSPTTSGFTINTDLAVGVSFSGNGTFSIQYQ